MYQFFLGSQFESDFLPAERGRESIAVNQPTGGGRDYPFTFKSDVGDVIADAYLYACGGGCNFERPFSIGWLYGFGQTPAFTDVMPTHDQDVLIVDANGLEVFNSVEADVFSAQNWGDRLQVLEWKITSSEKILRLVQFLTADENSEGFSLPLFYRPKFSNLDDRVIDFTPARVKSLSTPISNLLSGRIKLTNGYNVSLEVEPPKIVPGQRPRTVITVNAVAGSGTGRYDPGCADSPVIRKVNGIGPDANGNVQITGGDCYRVERPINEVLDDAAGQVSIINHTLQILNDCLPCCTCDGFINTYEGMRRLRNTYADLFTRAHRVRDLYNSNVERWNAQRDCRLAQSIQVAVQPSCDGNVQFGIGFCNHDNVCLDNLVVIISFQYADEAGDIDPQTNRPFSANTVYSGAGDPEVVCGSNLRAGNFEANPQRTFSRNQPTPYPMPGTYPYFYGFWDRVQPGGFATLLFKLAFPGSLASDVVEAVIDAYSLPADVPVPIGSGDPPVPGYVLGSGPMTDVAKSYRVGTPYKISSGLLQTDCCT
jgi:hypothetical protein